MRCTTVAAYTADASAHDVSCRRPRYATSPSGATRPASAPVVLSKARRVVEGGARGPRRRAGGAQQGGAGGGGGGAQPATRARPRQHRRGERVVRERPRAAIGQEPDPVNRLAAEVEAAAGPGRRRDLDSD